MKFPALPAPASRKIFKAAMSPTPFSNDGACPRDSATVIGSQLDSSAEPPFTHRLGGFFIWHGPGMKPRFRKLASGIFSPATGPRRFGPKNRHRRRNAGNDQAAAEEPATFSKTRRPAASALGKYYQGHVSGKIASVRFYGDPAKTDYGFLRTSGGGLSAAEIPIIDSGLA